jgi:hypothetical protein
MDPKRRRKGFERAGSFGPGQLGLPAGCAREIQLALAWSRVAGDAISRHAKALGVRRGVLQVEVNDERWKEAVQEILPQLTGRLAAICPELRIRKFRLLTAESEEVV